MSLFQINNQQQAAGGRALSKDTVFTSEISLKTWQLFEPWVEWRSHVPVGTMHYACYQ